MGSAKGGGRGLEGPTRGGLGDRPDLGESLATGRPAGEGLESVCLLRSEGRRGCGCCRGGF